jgi:D-inositol-3-phosphate glycosyltransferase
VREAAKHPEWEFRLAGVGELKVACERLAEDLHCANVVFLGHLNATQLGEEMRGDRIFFHPSEVEGHPQVLVQAAACGLACVARSSYRPEYIVDGVTGLLAASDNGLGEALHHLLREPELTARMSAAAIQHAKKFDWDRITDQWEELLELAVARRREGQRT